MNPVRTTFFLELECLVDPQIAHDHTDAIRLGPSISYSTRKRLEYGDKLAKIIEPYIDAVEIVITDWVAIHAPLTDLRSSLPDSVGARVIGSIYLDELTNSSWSDYRSALATRFSCIQLWLHRRRPKRVQDWLALDLGRQLDDWPLSERTHLICGSLSNPNVQHQLAKRLTANMEKASYVPKGR